jgi:hypothetical protein
MDDLLARLLAKLKLAAKKADILGEFEAIKATHVRCAYFALVCWPITIQTVLPLEQLRHCEVAPVWADAAEYAGYDLTTTTVKDGKVLIPISQALHKAFEAFHQTMVDEYHWYLDFLDELSAGREVLDWSGKLFVYSATSRSKC